MFSQTGSGFVETQPDETLSKPTKYSTCNKNENIKLSEKQLYIPLTQFERFVITFFEI